jgi:hypothetical protein
MSKAKKAIDFLYLAISFIFAKYKRKRKSIWDL